MSYLLAELARAVHWPNPLVWLALYRQRLEGERACDDQVLGYGDAASAYAEDLLAVVRAFRAAPPLPRAALAMADRTRVGGRVRAILDPKQARGRVGRFTVLVAGALTISVAAATTVVTPIAGVQVVESLAPLRVEGEAWSQAAILLPDDRIAVADRGSSEARFFDRSGDFLSRVGGPGAGSGELGFIRGMGLCGGDVLSVSELDFQAVVLSPSGSYERAARPYQSGDGPGRLYRLNCAPSGDYVAVGWPE